MDWPFAAKTGIGSLPHAEVDAGLRLSFSADVPFLPELENERMVAWAIAGLPGAEGGSVNFDAWRRRRDPFAFELMGPVEAFAPKLRAWQPFLRELALRKTPIAKVQLCGPDCVLAVVRPQDDELKGQILALLKARARAMIGAVAKAGAQVLFFVDEPMPGPELPGFLAEVKSAGAIDGIHCCGRPDWAALLALKPKVVSFDARLGLDALLEDPKALRASGAALAIGIIPTDPGARYAVGELVDAVDVSLRSTGCLDLLKRALLTPACGLALRTVADAERIHGEVAEAQLRLRA